MREMHTETETGAIVFDADLVPEFPDRFFHAEYWAERGRLEGQASGRGVVHFVSSEYGGWALRHYRRGGMMARLLKDQYWFSGQYRTRSFREWRLLAALRDLRLPVPAPVAARFTRRGPVYRADLITQRLEQARPFAQVLLEENTALDQVCQEIGACIRQFHDARVNHADLNVHNIMVTPQQLFLLDFDKGRIEASPGAWQERNLSRLHRSMLKVSERKLPPARREEVWRAVEKGYARKSE